ncbi:MAG: molybdenum cofactor biosynthesis protein MoaE [Myxococcota bacterium]
MRFRVRLFAICRERAQRDEVEIELSEGTANVAAVKSAIARQYPALAPLLPAVRVAVNETFGLDDDPVQPTDELALIPPVSGGQDLFEVRTEPLEVAEVEAAVRHGGAGAVVSFTGTVRDNTKGVAVEALEYEAYRSMAQKYLRSIGQEISQKWPHTRVAMLHRVGRLDIGEASVVIAVSSPHRADAFDACRYSIERLKEDVPIWKKEFRTDGSVWVGVGS